MGTRNLRAANRLGFQRAAAFVCLTAAFATAFAWARCGATEIHPLSPDGVVGSTPERDNEHEVRRHLEAPGQAVTTLTEAPENLTVEMLLAAHLSWSPVGCEETAGYYVYRSVNDGLWENIAYVTRNLYTDGSVLPGSTYRYRVCAVDTGGAEGPRSPATEAVTVTAKIREAEDFNYGGGQWPGPGPDDVPAVEAPSSEVLSTSYDYFYFATEPTTSPPDASWPNPYRPKDDVCILEVNPCQFALAYLTPGDWLRYTFEVPGPGPDDPPGGWVKIELKAASPFGGTLVLYWDEACVGKVYCQTVGWDSYGCFLLDDAFASGHGQHVLRVEVAEGDLRLDTVGVAFNCLPPAGQQIIWEEDFDDYTHLYTYEDVVNAGWTVVNGSSYADAAWRLWNTDAAQWLGNEDPNIAGMTENYMISDSDIAPDAAMDEELITPPIDCTKWIKLRLDFNKNFRIYPDDTSHLQVGEVDIRTYDEQTGSWGEWTNVLHFDRNNVADINSNPEQIDLTAYDEKRIQIRWHLYQAQYDYWFAVDDVMLSGQMTTPPRLQIAHDSDCLNWDGFGNGRYTVQYCDDLASGVWRAVPEDWPITERRWNIAADLKGLLRRRFYRIMAGEPGP